MTILAPGTFKVSDYRKSMPTRTKLAAVARDHEYDHDPALANRPYDTEAGDFIPPQNDPDFIVIRRRADHDEKTFGRKAGAAKTVSTRGSDVGEAARSKDIRTTEAVHRAKQASKAGRYQEAAEILAGAPRQSRLSKPPSKWPKRKLQSRGFERRA